MKAETLSRIAAIEQLLIYHHERVKLLEGAKLELYESCDHIKPDGTTAIRAAETNPNIKFCEICGR